MMRYHTTLLLSVAWTLLIFNDKQAYCGTVVVSSQYGTFCNGMRCPPGSSCMVSVNVINGNRTSVKSCSNFNGEVVRQEVITVSNGETCIKNLTMMGEKVNVEQSCRNLTKEEAEQLKNNQKIQATVQAALEQRQHAIADAMEERSKLHEKQMRELESRIKKITEGTERALERQADAVERAAEAGAERLEARLSEMQRKLEAMFR